MQALVLAYQRRARRITERAMVEEGQGAGERGLMRVFALRVRCTKRWSHQHGGEHNGQ